MTQRSSRDPEPLPLFDVDKAYIHVYIDPTLFKWQRVWVGTQVFVMTRMGFGLNIATRVLFLIIQHTLKEYSGFLPYRDDSVVTGDDALQQLVNVRATLLQHCSVIFFNTVGK